MWTELNELLKQYVGIWVLQKHMHMKQMTVSSVLTNSRKSHKVKAAFTFRSNSVLLKTPGKNS